MQSEYDELRSVAVAKSLAANLRLATSTSMRPGSTGRTPWGFEVPMPCLSESLRLLPAGDYSLGVIVVPRGEETQPFVGSWSRWPSRNPCRVARDLPRTLA